MFLIVGIWVISPFMLSVLAALLIAYAFYPVYKVINNKLKRKNLSALLVSILLILLITVPLIVMANSVYKEMTVGFIIVRQKISSANLLGEQCTDNSGFVCSANNYVKGLLSDPKTKYQIDEFVKKSSRAIIDSISGFIFSIPKLLMNVFIMLFVMFYLFRDGKELVNKLERIIPLKTSHKTKIIRKFNDVTYGVIYGQLIVAFIQGAIGGTGMYIIGLVMNKFGGVYSTLLLGAPIMWGALMAFFALIPYLGTTIIWLPISVLLMINGYLSGSGWLLSSGIALALYGMLIISSIDNIIRPKIISDKSKVHPALVLLGVLGGLKLFGIIGLILGPVILGIMVTFIDIYEEEASA